MEAGDQITPGLAELIGSHADERCVGLHLLRTHSRAHRGEDRGGADRVAGEQETEGVGVEGRGGRG
jgi:hypothetical protein